MTEDKTALTEKQVVKQLALLDGWRLEGKYISKDFRFANYREINRFLPYLTSTIVEQNHHPDFTFNGAEKRVSVTVTTHSEGGVTQADIHLARALNAWNERA